MKNKLGWKYLNQHKNEIIVKAQVLIFTNSGYPELLIYNEGRAKEHWGKATDEFFKLMDGEKEKFFYATIENNNFVILEEAPWQNWQ